MSTVAIRVRETIALYEHPYEHDVARRWWNLELGTRLPLHTGDAYSLLYAGRPGSAAGPDVHDAVLIVEREGRRLTGDVEFHIRSSDWSAHGHQRDPRYNNVILHVVLFCDASTPTQRQDGSCVPICSLHDIAAANDMHSSVQPVHERASWPCQRTMPQLSDEERARLLRRAGLLRFEQKIHAFVEQLHSLPCTGEPSEPHRYDLCLLPALAEGLAYGRDRAFFRAVGLRLLNARQALPEPLGRVDEPPPLDAQRLRALSRLLGEWGGAGVWPTLFQALHYPDSKVALQTLHSRFLSIGLSLARADILICNVVLPFAAAVALLEGNPALGEYAQQVYEQHPGLPSNRITRAMCAQLQLHNMPKGSCQQQGLHYIYQQTCREKQCRLCIAGRAPL